MSDGSWDWEGEVYEMYARAWMLRRLGNGKSFAGVLVLGDAWAGRIGLGWVGLAFWGCSSHSCFTFKDQYMALSRSHPKPSFSSDSI